jgi:hypothetical protein
MIILLLGFIAPKDYSLQRTMLIETPRKTVYDEVNSLSKMSNWFPWTTMDSSALLTYTGTDGTVGANMQWIGKTKYGEGEQKIIHVRPMRGIDTKVRFNKPIQAVHDLFLKLEDDGNNTRVKWRMEGQSPFPFNIFNLFIDMDVKFGKDYEKGLQQLRRICLKKKDLEDRFHIQDNVMLEEKNCIILIEQTATSSSITPIVDSLLIKQHLSSTYTDSLGSAIFSLVYVPGLMEDQSKGMIEVEIENIKTGDENKSFSFPKCQATMITYSGSWASRDTAKRMIEDHLKSKEDWVWELKEERFIQFPDSKSALSPVKAQIIYRSAMQVE